MTDTNTIRPDAPPFEPGAEITVTVTGRVIHHNSDATLIEYVKSNGFTDRVIVHNSADVEFRTAPAPDQATLAARERAARLVAVACMDPDSRPRVHAEWVARWNDAYPPGTLVRYWTGHVDRDGQRGRTSGAAWLFAEHTAAVRVEDSSDPIALSHIEPINGERARLSLGGQVAGLVALDTAHRGIADALNAAKGGPV